MVQFAVLRSGPAWDVFRDGARRESAPTRLEAIEAAYLAALATRERGEPAELLVQDDGGEIERWPLHAWTYVQPSDADVNA